MTRSYLGRRWGRCLFVRIKNARDGEGEGWSIEAGDEWLGDGDGDGCELIAK
jgi:hypothetical protein